MAENHGHGAADSGEARTGRLFFALWPDEATLQRLLQWQHSQPWPTGSRTTPAQDLHLTLHFIGAIDAVKLPPLMAADLASSPIELSFTQAALWRQGLAVLLAPHVPPPLHRLHDQIAAVLREHALPFDAQPYRPHVTMARAAGGAVPGVVSALRWSSQGHVLAMRDGPHYRVLQRWPRA